MVARDGIQALDAAPGYHCVRAGPAPTDDRAGPAPAPPAGVFTEDLLSDVYRHARSGTPLVLPRRLTDH